MYKEFIAPVFEAMFLPCSFGFRPGLGVQDAVAQVTGYRNQNLRWVLLADIKDCFDTINDNALALVEEHVQNRLLLHYIRLWLRAKILAAPMACPQAGGGQPRQCAFPAVGESVFAPGLTGC